MSGFGDLFVIDELTRKVKLRHYTRQRNTKRSRPDEALVTDFVSVN